MDMKAKEKRLKGIWHWDTGEEIDRRNPDRFLLYGNGWLYSILDHCIGGNAFVLDAPARYQLLLVTKGAVSYLLVSAFDLDRKVHTPEPLRITIPRNMLPPRGELRARSVSLTESNSVFRVIKDDLATAKLLSPRYARADVLAPVRMMSGPRGTAYVNQHFEKYETLQIESLTLKPFPGEIRRTAKGCDLNSSPEPGSVTAIVIE